MNLTIKGQKKMEWSGGDEGGGVERIKADARQNGVEMR